MNKIDVIFPEGGSIIVLQDPKPVVAEQAVQWHFHSYRNDVADVRIEFADHDANFFKVGGVPQNHFQINLRNRKFMWATPHQQHPNNKNRKYSIVAWDSAGKKLEELDPRIIIEDP